MFGGRRSLERQLGMRSIARSFVAAVLAAAALSSCSSPETDAGAPASNLPDASGNSADPAGVVAGSTQELEALMVTEVPAGFVLQPDDVGDTGPSDLAKAVRDDPTAGAEEALRSEGFVRGYQQLWVGPRDTEIIVFVYQFETETGAQSDFRRAKANLAEEGLPDVKSFTVSDLPGESNAVSGSSADFAVAIVQVTTGVYSVQVVSNGPSSAGLEEQASSVARDQSTRL